MTHSTRTERTGPAGAVTRTTRDLTRAAVSGWLGTAMEFMDFQLYSWRQPSSSTRSSSPTSARRSA
ncbi:hypothetical protein NKH77_08560 [Streptomyces sp. M19]